LAILQIEANICSFCCEELTVTVEHVWRDKSMHLWLVCEQTATPVNCHLRRTNQAIPVQLSRNYSLTVKALALNFRATRNASICPLQVTEQLCIEDDKTELLQMSEEIERLK
jgi:hypothetical protein